MADTTIRAIIKLLVEGGHIPKEVAKDLTDVGKAGKTASSGLTETGKSAATAGGLLKTSLASLSVGVIAGVMAALAALRQLTAFVVSSVKEYAGLERRFNAVRHEMQTLGIDATQALPKVKAFLDSLGAEKLKDTLPTFQKFLGITKDVDAALAATKLAADASESGLIDLGQASDALAQIMQGKAAGAATALGIELRKQSGQMKTNAELVEEFEKKFGGLGDAFNDTEDATDKFSASWSKMKMDLGQSFAAVAKPVIEFLSNIPTALRSLGPIAVKTGFELAGFFTGLGKAAAAAFDLKTIATEGFGAYAAKIKGAFQEGLATFAPEIEGAKEELDALWAKTGQSSGNAYAEGLKKLIEQANRARQGEESKAAREAAEKRLEFERGVEQRILETKIAMAKEGSAERLALEKQLYDLQETIAVEAARKAGSDVELVHEEFRQQRALKDKASLEAGLKLAGDAEAQLLAARIAAAKEGSDERLTLELAQMRRIRDLALRDAEQSEAAKAAIREAFRISEEAAIAAHEEKKKQDSVDTEKKRADEALAALRSLLDAKHELQQEDFKLEGELALAELAKQEADELAAIEHHEREKEAVRAKYRKLRATAEEDAVKKRKQLLVQQRAGEIADALAIAETWVGVAATIFNKNKSLAIAQAVISALVGAARAIEFYGPTPWGFAMAAVALAQGYARVREIRATTLGSTGGGAGATAAAAAPQPPGSGVGAPGSASGTPTASPMPGAPAGSGPKAIGQGFDDPAHDRAAYLGGRRWAEDFVRNTESGWREGLRTEEKGRPAMSPAPAKFDREAVRAALSGPGSTLTAGARAGGPSLDAQEIVSGITKALEPLAASTESREPKSVDQSVTINGNIYGGDEGLRQLSRELTRAKRLDSHRVI
jgi:hypothetical protein